MCGKEVNYTNIYGLQGYLNLIFLGIRKLLPLIA
jgi:hypothetical protein